MAWFGIGGPKVEAPKRAKAAPAPKPDQGAPTQPLVRPDANAAMGLTGYKAGVRAAKTQPLTPMPWAAGFGGLGSWLGGLKRDYVDTYTKSFKDNTQAFIAKHNWGPQGKAVLVQMANDGKFAQMDPQMNNLLNHVEKYMEKGGRKDLALTLLKQIANPDTIQQANQNTCAAATLQKALATQNPAKYFRMMTQLCDDGKTQVGGVELTTTKANRSDIQAAGIPMDQRASAYFQAAATEFANGAATYDFDRDKSKVDRKGTENDKEFSGVGFNRAKEMNEILMGAPTIEPDRLKDHLEAAMGRGRSRTEAIHWYVKDKVKEATEADQPGVFLAVKSLKHKDKAHMMLVRGVDEQGNYKLVDANGKERTWTPQQMAERAILTEDKNIGDNAGIMTTSGTATPTTTYTAPPPRRR
ncbi:MAG: hypothetical protein ACK46X_03890 [Candidatus Sericytochromatia bacterium]